MPPVSAAASASKSSKSSRSSKSSKRTKRTTGSPSTSTPKQSKTPTSKARESSGDVLIAARNEGIEPTWEYKPPAKFTSVHDTKGLDFEFGEFDYDAVKNDQEVEVWLVRVPEPVSCFLRWGGPEMNRGDEVLRLISLSLLHGGITMDHLRSRGKPFLMSSFPRLDLENMPSMLGYTFQCSGPLAADHKHIASPLIYNPSGFSLLIVLHRYHR